MNDRHKMFCEQYVSNGYKSRDAYLAVYPNAAPQTASSNATKLLKDKECLEYIKEIQHDRFEALNINADKIAIKLNEIAFDDDKETLNYQLKALELLAKQLGLYVNKVDADINAKTEITINIGEEENVEVD